MSTQSLYTVFVNCSVQTKGTFHSFEAGKETSGWQQKTAKHTEPKDTAGPEGPVLHTHCEQNHTGITFKKEKKKWFRY